MPDLGQEQLATVEMVTSSPKVQYNDCGEYFLIVDGDYNFDYDGLFIDVVWDVDNFEYDKYLPQSNGEDNSFDYDKYFPDPDWVDFILDYEGYFLQTDEHDDSFDNDEYFLHDDGNDDSFHYHNWIYFLVELAYFIMCILQTDWDDGSFAYDTDDDSADYEEYLPQDGGEDNNSDDEKYFQVDGGDDNSD